MKDNGNCFEYKEERDIDLMRAFRSLIKETGEIYYRDIYEKVVNMPASRFWVSEERASIVVGSMMNGSRKYYNGLTELQKEKYDEIFRRAKIIMERQPGLYVNEAVAMVVMQKAPKFYLSPSTAYAIIRRAKKKCYEEKKKKLRHLFY